MKKYTVAVIGLGVVGHAIYDALGLAGYKTLGYSPSKQYNSYEEIASQASIIFLVVGTPSREDGAVNMDAIYDVMENLEDTYEKLEEQDPLSALISRPIIVIKSTVIPGTNAMLQKLYPRYTFVSSPEFLTELNALDDFQHSDRIIIGCDNTEVFVEISQIYLDIEEEKENAIILQTKPIEAELIKYFSNNFLATKVTFANEAEKICKLYGVSWNGNISRGVGLDRRIGDSHFEVTEKGGFGGMCFPKDTKGLYNETLLRGYIPRLLETVIQLNEQFRSKQGKDPFTNLNN